MFHIFNIRWRTIAIIAMRCYGVYIARSHLKEIRLIKGYTIRALAARSGITREWIERIEKQDNPNLRIATICKLAGALGVRPEELITYEWITNKWALTAQREEWYHRYRTNVRYLAELAGINKSQIVRIESGQSDPHYTTLLRIAQALGITVGDFADDG